MAARQRLAMISHWHNHHRTEFSRCGCHLTPATIGRTSRSPALQRPSWPSRFLAALTTQSSRQSGHHPATLQGPALDWASDGHGPASQDEVHPSPRLDAALGVERRREIHLFLRGVISHHEDLPLPVFHQDGAQVAATHNECGQGGADVRPLHCVRLA